MPDTQEYMVNGDVVVPFPDHGKPLSHGQIVTAADIPPGSLQPMLNMGQLLPITDEGATPTQPEEPAEPAEMKVGELGLSKTIVDKLEQQGLVTRGQVVAYAQANEGFGDLLTDKQAESVVEALQATAPAE